MTHSKKIMRNTAYSLGYKLLTIFISFFIRKLFIEYLSVELLGLNSLFADLLSFLNLADMGLGVALQFNLYKPIAEKDDEKIARLLNAAKKIYNTVGYGMIIVGCIMCFFIQYLIKDNPYELGFLRMVFFINVLGNASTYFYVHKRLFMQTVEDMHITNIVDSLLFFIASIIKIVAIVVFRNYYAYIIIGVVQGVVSNALVNHVCNKKYSYLTKYKGYTSEEMTSLFENLKQLIPNKLGNFVFNNTDNTIISAFLGLTMVTYYTNYFSITNQVFLMASIVGGVVKVSFGNVMQEQKDVDKHMLFLRSYQLLQFFYSSICGVLLVCLLDDFVAVWYGEKFVLPLVFVVILTLDFFVHSMYQPLSMFLEILGDFKTLKKQQLISVTLNIILSVGLIFPLGLVGPVIGTFVVDVVTFYFRINTVLFIHYKEYFKDYISKLVKYIIVFLCQYILLYILSKKIIIGIGFINMLIKAVIVGIVSIAMSVVMFRKTKEFEFIMSKIKKQVD